MACQNRIVAGDRPDVPEVAFRPAIVRPRLHFNDAAVVPPPIFTRIELARERVVEIHIIGVIRVAKPELDHQFPIGFFSRTHPQ